jgi:RNA polymerase sigma factor (sigma-70 family)
MQQTDDELARRFEAQRPHLRAVAYRMLGSLAEADDAVQETWLRLSRSDAGAIENLGGWLTTVVSRVCLNQLRTRASRKEESLDTRMPEPIVGPADGTDPEHEALLGDAVGLALLVVLDALGPAERVAFVLHDLFDVPFDAIAPVVGRSSAATRQLASRARRRVRDARAVPDPDRALQRRVVAAFHAAARAGDLQALLAVLDPDVVLRADFGTTAAARFLRGASDVAGSATLFAQSGLTGRPALVNGAAGALSLRDGELYAVLGFTVHDGRIVAIDILADPERLAALDVSFLG